jgi:hypothetical protein
MSTRDRMKRLRQKKAATGERSYLVWLAPDAQQVEASG